MPHCLPFTLSYAVAKVKTKKDAFAILMQQNARMPKSKSAFKAQS